MLSHQAVQAEVALLHDPSVPVMSPRLPSADRLLPYLRRIDAARNYTNFGPLVLELESRLTERLSLPAGGLVTASSGTAALVGATLAVAGRATVERPFALMPAYTFVATAVAAEQCGYQPYLADVNADTWMLDPERLLDHPALDQIGLVMPVAAYGKKVAQAPWLEFKEKTGIPVVIDGAAGFEAVDASPGETLGRIPVVMSFHATKSFACGEGGAVVCTDPDVVMKTTRALNFGFHNSRDSCSASINGKLSEYHAAIGLAELDDWAQKQRSLRMVTAGYRHLFGMAGLSEALVAAPEVCSSYILFQFSNPFEALQVQSQLQERGIGFRLWYGQGLHSHPHYANAAADRLDTSNQLAPLILGLPMAPDLARETIERVVAGVVSGLL